MNFLKTIVLLASFSLGNVYATLDSFESHDRSRVYVDGFLVVEYDTIRDAVISYFGEETRLNPFAFAHYSGMKLASADDESIQECTSFADCTILHLEVPVWWYTYPPGFFPTVKATLETLTFGIKGSSIPIVSELELIDY